MEQRNTVRLVEEEKFGWTILSTVRDGALDSATTEKKPWERNPSGEKLGELEQAESLVEKETDEPFTGPRDFTAENTQEEKEKQAPDEEKEEEEEEGSDDHDEGGVDDDDDYDDGDDMNVFAFGDSRRAFPWEPERLQEANPKFGGTPTLVQQQPGHKHGLMWTVSLVATLGFFGWAVMNGLSGGSKNFRCLKLHPCSIKEGEPVLNSL